MKKRYNYCTNCHKWLGWTNFLKFWERTKTCEDCQIQQGMF